MLYSQEPWLREHKLEAHLTNPDTQGRNGLSIYINLNKTTRPIHTSLEDASIVLKPTTQYHSVNMHKNCLALTLRTPTNYM